MESFRVVGKFIDPRTSYVLLFGSRATGRHKPNADYDVGIYTGEEIPLKVLAQIQDELEEVPIPVGIDIVDLSSVSKIFRKIAVKNAKVWNTPKRDLKLI